MAINNPALLASFDANQTNTQTPPPSQVSDGYAANEIPLSEHHGFMFNEFYKYLNHLKETGISQWDNTVSYSQHARIMRDGTIYSSISDANQGNDPISTFGTFWSHSELNRVPKTGIQDTEDWNGTTYTDPDAIGTNPSAKIYPDGTVVGNTDNGSYIKYPNGEVNIYGTKLVNINPTVVSGSIYFSFEVLDLPISLFAGTDRSSEVSSESADSTHWTNIKNTNDTSVTAFLFASVNTVTIDKITFHVKGRWKA